MNVRKEKRESQTGMLSRAFFALFRIIIGVRHDPDFKNEQQLAMVSKPEISRSRHF